VRTRRVHYDWLEAGEHTQRTVAQLSQQLRRFLDDQAWLENRRIMDILHGIEAKALALRDTPPTGTVMSIADTAADRTADRAAAVHANDQAVDRRCALEAGDGEVDAAVLFSQVVVDRAQLARHIRHALQDRSQMTLRELCETRPLEHGLAELVAYLQLADDTFKAVIDEGVTELIVWTGMTPAGHPHARQARLPRVIFCCNNYSISEDGFSDSCVTLPVIRADGWPFALAPPQPRKEKPGKESPRRNRQ
jgi:hypothetical protein